MHARSLLTLNHVCNVLKRSLLVFMALTPLLAKSAWPEKPIRLIVPFAPGGAPDLAARIIAPSLQKQLGQTVVVENRAGAGATIGTTAVANATGDGYTLLIGSAANAIDSAIQKKLPYVFERDLVPVLMVAEVPGVLVVPKSLGVNSVQELLTYAKSKPANTLSYGSPGFGTSVHLAGELFDSMTGINMVHVPYKGAAPAINDLLGMRLQLMFPALAAAQAHIQSGALKALAVTTKTRSTLAPDLPTIGELGFPGYEVGGWLGIFAPKGLPAEVLDRIQRGFEESLKEASTRLALARQGIEANPAKADALRERVGSDMHRWSQLIKTRNIEPQ